MIKVREFKVTGLVQGVGLRFFIHSLALSLNLRGEVWNASDGSVQGVVVGDKVDRLIRGIEDGPGRVDAVMCNDTIGSDFTSFEIGPSR